jgi:phage-related protein
MTWQIIYYSERVREAVFSLPSGIRADYLRLAEMMIAHGADLRMPHSRTMGDGLFELRPKGKEGIGRVFYCIQIGQKIVVLHSFIKKEQKTPPKELHIALRRMKEVKNET